MKFLSVILTFFLLLFTVDALTQSFELDSISELGSQVRESSGLLYRQGRLITHNDSGDAPMLYELDTVTGEVLREIWVDNASHLDWEDITADDSHLYIADIGNNFGTRTDLVIYRVSWSEYWSQDTVAAQRIDYAYEDQTDFSSNQFFTPYDAESLQFWSDSLYVFTKDWSTDFTRIYRLPRQPGQYQAVLVDSLPVPGLVTAIDAHPLENSLLMTAYDGAQAYLIKLDDFIDNQFSTGTPTIWDLPLSGSFKTEGVCWRDMRWAYLTTEATNGESPILYRLDTDFTVLVESPDPLAFRLYPQPATDVLYLETDSPLAMELYSLSGQFLKRSTEQHLSLALLPKGLYVLKLSGDEGFVGSKLVVKQ